MDIYTVMYQYILYKCLHIYLYLSVYTKPIYVIYMHILYTLICFTHIYVY